MQQPTRRLIEYMCQSAHRAADMAYAAHLIVMNNVAHYAYPNYGHANDAPDKKIKVANQRAIDVAEAAFVVGCDEDKAARIVALNEAKADYAAFYDAYYPNHCHTKITIGTTCGAAKATSQMNIDKAKSTNSTPYRAEIIDEYWFTHEATINQSSAYHVTIRTNGD